MFAAESPKARVDDHQALGDPFGPQPFKSPDTVDLVDGEDLDNLQVLKAGQARLDKLPGFYDWRPDRKLTEKQKSRLRKLAALIMDDRIHNNWRGGAIHELGEWGHACAIPVLVEALTKTEPRLGLRERSVYALSKIADKRVINPLIESVGDINVGYGSDQQLRKITKANWGGWNTPDQAEQRRDPVPTEAAELQGWLKRRQQRWRQWWQEQGEKIQLDRRAAYQHAGPY